VALRPTGERGTVPNEDASLPALVAQLQAVAPTWLVREATGGSPRAAVAALAAAGLPVVVAPPRQPRDFAKAPGQLAKTEALDARALAHCAEAVRPPPRPRPEAQTEALRALLTRRRPRVVMRPAALAGVAPCNRDRGTLRGHRTIWGKKVALVACMRQLLTILHAMGKHQTPWQPQEVAIA
jgi:hypothetical protein